MTQIVRQSNTVQRQYNASDIQPRLTQDQAQMALVNQLADALAQRLNQSTAKPPQQQPTTHIHYHQHVKQDSGLAEAMTGLIVVSAVLVGLFATCAAIYQGSRAELPTMEDVA